MKKYAIVILVGLLISACDLESTFVKDIQVLGESEIVVISHISPEDEVVEVVVMTAKTIGEPTPTDAYINDAEVVISDGENDYIMTLVENVINEDRNFYYTNVPYFTYQISNDILNVTEGKTYHLTVKARGQTLQASCTVPTGIIIPKMTLSDTTGSPFFNLSWTKKDSETGFYGVKLQTYNEVDSFPHTDYFTGDTVSWENYTRQVHLETGNYFSSTSEQSEVRFREEIWFYPKPNENTELIVYLIHADENYYRYHKTVQDANYQEGNPFAEPIIIHSNIENGAGCFGAYITSKTRFPIIQ